MSNYEKLYWITRMDSIQGLFAGMLIVSGIALGAYFFIYLLSSGIEDDSWCKSYKKNWRWLRITCFILIPIGALGYTLVPNRNEAIIILAGGATMNFVQADTSVNKLPAQTTAFISEYLDKQIKELKEENKK